MTYARNRIQELGDSYYQLDFCTLFTIQLLYLVEFANWNSQSKIGYGGGNDYSSPYNTGGSDSMPYHTGTIQTSRTIYAGGIQYRNIEDLWANVCDFCDGCYFYKNYTFYIAPDQRKISATNNGIYGGIKIDKISNGGFPSKFNVNSNAGFPIFYPTEFNGSNSTYSCDSTGFGNNDFLYVGGSIYRSRNIGIFYNMALPCGNTSSIIGARIQELP